MAISISCQISAIMKIKLNRIEAEEDEKEEEEKEEGKTLIIYLILFS